LRAGQSMLLPGVLLALTALTRLEAITILAVFYFVLWRSGARFLQRAFELATPGCVVLGGHEIWRHAYYGQWLPNTFTAKVGIPGAALLSAGVGYAATFAKSAAPALVALVIAIRRAPRSASLSLQTPALAIAWMTLLIILTGGGHFGLFRFFVAAVALTAVLVGRVADAFLTPGSDRGQTRVRPLVGLAVILAVNGSFLASPEVVRP